MSNQNDHHRDVSPATSGSTLAVPINRHLRCRLESDAGAGMAEYTFLLLLVALPLVIVFPGLATAIQNAIQLVINAF